jgi:hypothetical protein
MKGRFVEVFDEKLIHGDFETELGLQVAVGAIDWSCGFDIMIVEVDGCKN